MTPFRRVLPLPFLVVLLTACGGGELDEGRFRSYLSEEPANLDPAYAVDKASGSLTSLIYPGLFRFTPEGEPRPDLVKAWSRDESGLSYRFLLNTDRRFDDGSLITAADVRRCFRRLLDPDHPSPRRWVLERLRGAEAFREGLSSDLSGLEAPDDSTLVITLSAPFSPFTGLLAMPATRIYPAG